MQRQPSVRRLPSIDGARKPRRSESELPDSAVVAAARKEAAEKAAATGGAPAPSRGMKVCCCPWIDRSRLSQCPNIKSACCLYPACVLDLVGCWHPSAG